MEHRLSIRKPIALDVLIFHQGIPAVLGKSRNIGLEGMYVETKSVSFPKGTALEVEFALKTDNWEQPVQWFHIPALVIHRSHEGMGLMFSAFTPAVFESIQAL